MVVSVFCRSGRRVSGCTEMPHQGDVDETVFATGGSEDAQFDGIEGISGVAACHVCKEVEGRLHLSGLYSFPFLFVLSLTARRMSSLTSEISRDFSSKMMEREIKAALTSKYGFSVVAPMRMMVPSSTNGRR